MDEFLGTIAQFGFDFAPIYWLHCHGQTLSIAQYTALFSLLGTKYGGDGQTTFCLPDLRKKDASGNYYVAGDIMSDGTPYIDSFICVEGTYPQRP